MLSLKQNDYVVIIEDEPSVIYPDRYATSSNRYTSRYILGDPRLITSVHGIRSGEPDPLYSCLILASGGPTAIHEQSAVLDVNQCVMAVSSFLVCLRLPDLQMLWHSEVDVASCLGVYHVPRYDSYISHGELEIARVAYDGQVLWSSAGKDIFTNGFTLFDEYVEVIDFNEETYHIDLLTGRSEILLP